ncbi:HNH endonuclease signature motif containing protein [Solimonas soli]|uniref:HNH endonuclease signature motif containing protein n=1 Tax=Solimonas soli TaxID=413479 RepID=UPI000485E13D|nr:HNH endonuclease signature motif containing protein [Solimonas soli]
MENISKFLVRLGFPLRVVRQSWGAHSDFGVLLTTWADDLDESGHFVQVLGSKAWRETKPSWGLSERIDHLRALWSGGLAGYTVIATAKDTKAHPRTIQSYDAENVRAITSLVVRPDGSIWAEVREDVPVGRLKKHAASHRLVPGDGPFPIARTRTKPFKASAAPYVAKLPAIRQWLIEVARRRGTVTYGEARAPFGLRTLEHRHAMDRIGHECLDAGEPILTSLIVDADTGRCSSGFFKEFRRDDVEEREDCYAFWSSSAARAPAASRGVATTPPSTGATRNGSLAERAARFAKAAVRPDQAAFRRRVFLAHHGACVVTGCTISEALDAAHRHGRDWRRGHNSGADGLLLRKDIHALYDAKLVSINDSGVATFDPEVLVHYRDHARRP